MVSDNQVEPETFARIPVTGFVDLTPIDEASNTSPKVDLMSQVMI